MKNPFTKFRQQNAFTLVEVICVIVIMGILSGITYTYFRDAIPIAQDRQAISAANTINGAKKAYELRVSTAASSWASAANDSARFLLIRDRIAFAEAMTLTQFTPTGYTFNLGTTITARVTITGSSGAISY